MKATIRLAHENDALKMLSIYAPIVRKTPTSFEIEPPSETEFKQRIKDYQKRLPWLVCELDGELLGYAYANPHRSRATYQWSIESSVYVAVKHRKKSVGKAMKHFTNL